MFALRRQDDILYRGFLGFLGKAVRQNQQGALLEEPQQSEDITTKLHACAFR